MAAAVRRGKNPRAGPKYSSRAGSQGRGAKAGPPSVGGRSASGHGMGSQSGSRSENRYHLESRVRSSAGRSRAGVTAAQRGVGLRAKLGVDLEADNEMTIDRTGDSHLSFDKLRIYLRQLDFICLSLLSAKSKLQAVFTICETFQTSRCLILCGCTCFIMTSCRPLI